MLLAKKCHFFLYLDLIEIRLEIMLSVFAAKKETFLSLKNRIFLLRFDQNKTRNNVSEFTMKKETFFDFKKQNFSNF